MTMISISISGKAYSVDATDQQAAALGLTRSKVMAQLPIGADQNTDTPISDRPGYRQTDIDYLTYIFSTIAEGDRSNQRLSQLLDAYVVDTGGQAPDPALIRAVPLSEDARKAQLRAYASDKRWRVETGGMVINGMPIPTDDRAKLLILGAATGMADGSSAPMIVNGVLLGTFPKSVFQQINGAVIAHVQATFPVLATLIAGINDGSITTPSQIDTANWPQ